MGHWDYYDYQTYTNLEMRQYELDIDLKIIRAAKWWQPMTYTALQEERERKLGSRLNIKLGYNELVVKK